MSSGFFDYGPGAGRTSTGGLDTEPKAILSGLSPQDWEHLMGFAARRRYAPGGAIITAGSAEPALYFLVSGAVRITAPRPGGLDAELEVLRDGAVFGIQSFLGKQPSAAAAAAVAQTEIIAFTPDTFAQLASWYPRIAIKLLSDLAAHVATRLRHHEVMT